MENKFTDNEIIKVLECCADGSGTGIIKATIDLIIRQKVEIERLKSHNNKLMETVENLIYECDCAKQETIKDFEEKLLALKIKPEFPWDDFYVTESMIKELAKEMIEEVQR